MTPWCARTGRWPYRTRAIALAAIRTTTTVHPTARLTLRPCAWCGGWHLTRKAPR